MVKSGWNKGQIYEIKIGKVLFNKGLLSSPRPTAGAVADTAFQHQGRVYKLEVKRNLLADYGQKALRWSKEDGWYWAKNDSITELYDFFGAMKLVQGKAAPLRYKIKEETKITKLDAERDRKSFGDTTLPVSSEMLGHFYASKGTHYIQVGGYGFYHLDADVAGLGTDLFTCDLGLRLRMKYIHKHKTQTNGQKVPTHWNYIFVGALKIKSKPNKSKFNIEKSRGQRFPPIIP